MKELMRSLRYQLVPQTIKERLPQIKRDDCGTYYKPALKGHHLRSIKHRRAVDKIPKVIPELKQSKYQTLERWLMENVKTFIKYFTNWLFPKQEESSPLQQTATDEISLLETAFKSRLHTWFVRNVRYFKDPTAFLKHCRPIKIDKFSQKVGVKVNMQLYCDHQKEQEILDFSLKIKNQIV